MAFRRFVLSRSVTVPVKSRAVIALFENRSENEYRKRFALKEGQQPDLGQNQQFKLMPFQVSRRSSCLPPQVNLQSQIDGFNWLCNNWWNHQHCILADEMGLVGTFVF
jgi:chromodomain-helicase-DNA-binding protein 4